MFSDDAREWTLHVTAAVDGGAICTVKALPSGLCGCNELV